MIKNLVSGDIILYTDKDENVRRGYNYEAS